WGHALYRITRQEQGHQPLKYVRFHHSPVVIIIMSFGAMFWPYMKKIGGKLFPPIQVTTNLILIHFMI
ncbi:hypothetical protein, partial [Aeromonas dhakensis]|uniref:hypothetical protein n=1 Tax=Aeromonas dhakensis TaxID=196024 RepID=UPI002379C931